MTDQTPYAQLHALPADDPLLTRKDLAARWQCSVSYIEKRPADEMPPRCHVLPGQVRYRLSDVLLFEASRVDRRHPLHLPAGGAQPLNRGSGRRPAALPVLPGFPIRLPVTTGPKPRRGGRPPRPAISDSEPG